MRTEGWPVGLHLAALIARDDDADAARISGDDRYVADYLYREALTRQPAEVQQFLRRSAVLDQLSGPLCDAVVGSVGRSRGCGTSSRRACSSSPSTASGTGTATTGSSGSSSSPSCIGSSRRGGQAAPAGGGLVRGQRLALAGGRAPPEQRPRPTAPSSW